MAQFLSKEIFVSGNRGCQLLATFPHRKQTFQRGNVHNVNNNYGVQTIGAGIVKPEILYQISEIGLVEIRHLINLFNIRNPTHGATGLF